MEKQRADFLKTGSFTSLINNIKLNLYEKSKLFYEFKTALHFHNSLLQKDSELKN